MAFYKPESIAPIVLNAVRNNRPFVFDHADQRRFFRETYADVVEACYDDIDAYEVTAVPPARPLLVGAWWVIRQDPKEEPP